jgi:hypothetical protein
VLHALALTLVVASAVPDGGTPATPAATPPSSAEVMTAGVPSPEHLEALLERVRRGRPAIWEQLRPEHCRPATDARPGETLLVCQTFAGCHGPCMDRVLRAVLRFDQDGGHIVSAGEGAADTGACGCCI